MKKRFGGWWCLSVLSYLIYLLIFRTTRKWFEEEVWWSLYHIHVILLKLMDDCLCFVIMIVQVKVTNAKNFPPTTTTKLCIQYLVQWLYLIFFVCFLKLVTFLTFLLCTKGILMTAQKKRSYDDEEPKKRVSHLRQKLMKT